MEDDQLAEEQGKLRGGGVLRGTMSSFRRPKSEAALRLYNLPRRELQALCKQYGIPANKTNVSMADALCACIPVSFRLLEKEFGSVLFSFQSFSSFRAIHRLLLKSAPPRAVLRSKVEFYGTCMRILDIKRFLKFAAPNSLLTELNRSHLSSL